MYSEWGPLGKYTTEILHQPEKRALSKFFSLGNCGHEEMVWTSVTLQNPHWRTGFDKAMAQSVGKLRVLCAVAELTGRCTDPGMSRLLPMVDNLSLAVASRCAESAR